MKASKKRITVYKAFVLEPILKHLESTCEALSHFGCKCEPPTKERLDSLIKQRAEIDLSCTEMSLEELVSEEEMATPMSGLMARRS